MSAEAVGVWESPPARPPRLIDSRVWAFIGCSFSRVEVEGCVRTQARRGAAVDMCVSLDRRSSGKVVDRVKSWGYGNGGGEGEGWCFAAWVWVQR